MKFWVLYIWYKVLVPLYYKFWLYLKCNKVLLFILKKNIIIIIIIIIIISYHILDKGEGILCHSTISLALS